MAFSFFFQTGKTLWLFVAFSGGPSIYQLFVAVSKTLVLVIFLGIFYMTQLFVALNNCERQLFVAFTLNNETEEEVLLL